MPMSLSGSPERAAQRPQPWGARLTPAVTSDGLRWDLSGHLELFSMRQGARGLLAERSTDEPWDDAREEAVERAVLVLDELASNALRHGRPPVIAQLFDRGET